MSRKVKMAIGITGFVLWMLFFLWLFVMSIVKAFTTWQWYWFLCVALTFYADFFGGQFFYLRVIQWVEEK